MSVIEKLDGVLAKWRDRARRNAVWSRYGGEEMVNCADELDTLMPAIRQDMIDARRLRAYRDATFDGNAVYAALDDRSKARTSADNVADVLDALNRVARLASDSATGEGEGHD